MNQENPFLPKPEKIGNHVIRRRAFDLLPDGPAFVSESDNLRKFFDATVDQWFQPAQAKNAGGFIGRKGGQYYRPLTQAYLDEPSRIRNQYQLEPSATSISNLGDTQFVFSYPDLVNQLAYEGAITDNHSRLFAQHYLSWAPPINIDMLVNFSNYYWLITGPTTHTITEPTNALLDIIGKKTHSIGSLVLESGMRIIFTNDENFEFNNTSWIVEGVGQSIQLIDDSEYDGFGLYDTLPYDVSPYDSVEVNVFPDYLTISRASLDRNPWARTNRWFHKELIRELNLENFSAFQARRPIIEFLPNIQLFNYGRIARQDVDFVIEDVGILDVAGQPSWTANGEPLFDGARVLFTNDPDPLKNNRVYRVEGINNLGQIGFNIDTDGQDVNGAPLEGEKIRLLQGTVRNKELQFLNGKWTSCQEKINLNQYPLYELYDTDSNKLSNQSIYPGSVFQGSRLFAFAENGQKLDPFLQLPVSFSTFGDIEFDNVLQTEKFSYDLNFEQSVIPGYYYYKVFSSLNQDEDECFNDWRPSKNKSRQRVIDEWVIRQRITDDGLVEFQRTFELSIEPLPNSQNLINRQILLNGRKLQENIDYNIAQNVLELSLTLELNDGDVLEARSWNSTMNIQDKMGYFEIPTNLQSNPNNEQVTSIKYNELIQHFVSIIENQDDFQGRPQGPNNFRNTPRDLSVGNRILNHSAPMLRTMLLLGDRDLNLPTAIRYAQREYNRFKNKFFNSIAALQTSSQLTPSSPTSEWISAILNQINAGKNDTFPFANSATASFMPSSPASLGLSQSWKPEIFIDDTRSQPTVVIRAHDGSLIDATGTFVDQIYLDFETMIFDNLLEKYRNCDYVPRLNYLERKPGYFRQTAYTLDEWKTLSLPNFDRWVITNRIDFQENISYNSSDPFSWNYSTCQGPDGNLLPGHWRGIYELFFDTHRPHTHPWEMLGFAIKPEWWDIEYGLAPYTGSNLLMWQDLENGVVRQGTRQGTHAHLKRPGLSNYIPVNSQGDLLDPVQAGIAAQYPSQFHARQPWKFGDVGPAEYTWKTGFGWSFDQQLELLNAHPNEYVEFGWDTQHVEQRQAQIIDSRTLNRPSIVQSLVHNERDGNSNVITVYGISQWVSDRLTSLGQDVTANFGTLVRDLSVNLTYKVGGYTKKNNMRILNDSFGLIPSENYKVSLYKSSSIKQLSYSAVIIERTPTGFSISGYDNLDQWFEYLPPVTSGQTIRFQFEETTVFRYKQRQKNSVKLKYGEQLNTVQEVFDFLAGYQAFLRSQSWEFDRFDEAAQRFIDFEYLSEQFVVWAKSSPQPGQTLVVSPLSVQAKVKVPQGQVDDVQSFVRGSYSILDRDGFGITKDSFAVSRFENEFVITSTNDESSGIYFLRLSLVEFEHIVLLDNVTKFDDLIYNPLLGLRQPRLRIFIEKTTEWTGRGEAFGFVIQDDGIVDNFEKSVSDIKNYFSFDKLNQNSTANQLAKGLIGFRPRDYLSSLLLDQQIEFEFYKGYIRQKGTQQPINNILRSEFITETADFGINEEWAFKIGEFGNTEKKSSIQLQLRLNDFRTNPQMFVFDNDNVDNPENAVIEIGPEDVRWVLKRNKNLSSNQFLLRNFQKTTSARRDLPNAGFIRTDEADYSFILPEELENLYLDQGTNFNDGVIFWQPIRNDGSWDVFRLNLQSKVSQIIQGPTPGSPAIIELESNHEIEPGDKVFIKGSTQTSPDFEGYWTVIDVPQPNQFTVEFPVETVFDFAPGEGPDTLVLKTIRFANVSQRDSYAPINGWSLGDLVYVDSATSSRWEVFEWNGISWDSLRQENDKVKTDEVFNQIIFDSFSNRNLVQPQLFDPFKGFIPSKAATFIDYMIDYDPAKYNSGDAETFDIDPEQAWGPSHVGELWFDLSTVRWVDYEQGSLDYRLSNWGRIAPGTRVDVYEWTKSPVPPEQWETYKASFVSQSADFVPSGKLKLGNEQPYVVRMELLPTENRKVPVYYFWVHNPDFVPQQTRNPRDLSARAVAQLIENPTAQQVTWFAPISTDAFILANSETFLNDTSTVMLINFVEKPDETTIHKQWLLARENDQAVEPYARLWQKMKDSLFGFDRTGLSVPDENLFESEKYGNSYRPRQSWFNNRRKARLDFVLKANKIFIDKNITGGIIGWDTHLFASEPIPDSTNWDQTVFSINDRNLLNNLIPIGTRVLVQSDQTQNGKWSIYTYQGLGDWNLERVQLFRTNDYWVLVDWFSPNLSSNVILKATVADMVERNQQTQQFEKGDIVRVNDDGTGVWAWFQLDIQNNNPAWVLVARQNGTIQLLESIADYDITNGSLDVPATLAFANVLLAIENHLCSILEKNQLFFAMVHIVHNQFPVIDWAFKTSYIFGVGNVDVLDQDFIFIANQSDKLLDYINEVKPYHVKVRGLLERKQVPAENILLDIDDSHRIVAKIKFDRVSCDSTIPEGANPKDYDVASLSASDRVQLFYQPTEGMPAKVLGQLIGRCEYAGTVLDGKSFYQFGTLLGAGYDFSEYDIPLGYDFSTSEIQEFYDVFVNGGSLDGVTVPVSVGDSGIIVDGYKFVQPDIHANRPEELVLTRAGDAVDIQVYIQPPSGPVPVGYDVLAYDTFAYDVDEADAGMPFSGGPRIRMKRLRGTSTGTTGPFSIGQLPLNEQSVFVYVNENLLDETDFTIDWSTANPTITLNSPVFLTDTVKIQSFGNDRFPDRRIFETNTSQTVWDLKQTITNNDRVYVSVDGEIADFTISGTEITITNPVPNNSSVLVLFFEQGNFSITRTQEEIASQNGTETFTIEVPAQSSVPSYLTTIVHRNSLRLNPPLMKSYVGTLQDRYFKTGASVTDSSKLRVWIADKELAPGFNGEFVINWVTHIQIDNGGQDYAVGETVDIIGVGSDAQAHIAEVDSNGAILRILVTQSGHGYDITPTTAINTLNGTGAVLSVQIADQEIQLLGNSISSEPDQILIVNESHGDYLIDRNDPTQLLIHTVSVGDSIKITTFTEDGRLGMQTESFIGNAQGFYPLGLVPYDASHVWVSVNGQRKTHIKDYVLKNQDEGFDSEFQGYGMTFDATDSYGVSFKEFAQDSNDIITVTYFTNRPESRPAAFRMFKNIFGDFEFLRIADQESTVLAQPLLPTDNQLVVEDATVLGIPNIAAHIPGVVFIRGERIIFWEVDTSVTGQHVLKRVLRGTGGTGINLDLSAGEVVRDASVNQRIPGGYVWQYAPEGFLELKNTLTNFLTDKPGRIDFGYLE